MSDTAPTGTPAPGSRDVLSGVTTTQGAMPAAAGMAPITLSGRGLAGRWICLARPYLLLLGFAPTIATLALLWANGAHLLILPAIFSILAVALVQAGANLLDEYLEFERWQRGGFVAGILRGDEAGAVLAASGIAPLRVLRASIGLLGIGALAGIPLVMSGGVGVALLGVCGLGAAFLYSSTTYALKRLPGGEAVVFLALGPGIAAAVALAQRSRLSWPVILIGCALGLLALALVEAAHVSGIERDEATGRRTLVDYIGVRGSRLLYGVCLAGAFALVALLGLPKAAPHGVLAVVVALPAALIALTGMVLARTTAARALIPMQTFRVYVLFALWLVVGLVASGIVALALGSGM
jgi:1,4-dihydroxy-2-naphthoate polyprenyltransferase